MGFGECCHKANILRLRKQEHSALSILVCKKTARVSGSTDQEIIQKNSASAVSITKVYV
jgi:hypothetical protein